MGIGWRLSGRFPRSRKYVVDLNFGSKKGPGDNVRALLLSQYYYEAAQEALEVSISSPFLIHADVPPSTL